MSFEQTRWVWMNGEIISWNNANVHVSAHTLHFGTGVFEGLRCYNTISDRPAVFRMKEHLSRLYTSAQIYGISIPYTPEMLASAVEDVIRHNGFSSCYIRIICFYGSNRLGLNPLGCPVEVAILAWPWDTFFSADSYQQGISVGISSWIKFDSRMVPATVKACGQYVNFFLALREVLDKGFHEAILLDLSGHLAEGPGANIFIIREGRLITNDTSSSILTGITQDSIINIARGLGYSVEISYLWPQDLLEADESFFTGTAVQVMPIREVDGRIIGQGRRGAITKRLQHEYSTVTSGEDQRFPHWLHYVS